MSDTFGKPSSASSPAAVNMGCSLLFLVLVLGIGACIGWYRASVQANLWQREGVEITTWEILWGAKPIERNINIKERS